VDDLPSLTAGEKTKDPLHFPASIWGTLEQAGDSDRFEFDAQAGQTLVFDLASKSVGSKADAILAILDRDGHVLASNNDFDASGDPLVSFTFKTAGRYTASVGDLANGRRRGSLLSPERGRTTLRHRRFPIEYPCKRRERGGTHRHSSTGRAQGEDPGRRGG
jgi:hypothetical protein